MFYVTLPKFYNAVTMLARFWKKNICFPIFGLSFKPVLFGKVFQFEISLLFILCMLIARMEMGTSRVSGDSDIIT